MIYSGCSSTRLHLGLADTRDPAARLYLDCMEEQAVKHGGH